MRLFNLYDKQTLRKKLEQETFSRRTISFYRYVIIKEPDLLRHQLFAEWSALEVLGRTYLAKEGINAQISVPEPNWEKFVANLESRMEFQNMILKEAVENKSDSFLKLTIKCRKKIVADGLDDGAFDVTNVGKHLSAEEFNKAMESPETIVVDMRNHYESEVGHFEGAILPKADTFRDELPQVLELLGDKKDAKVLMYCTGGIRCEKASAYLRHHGFQDVNQLHGGIISYAREIREKGLPSKFHGKNFVFDERLGERITQEIISRCHQCGKPSDRHINCENRACHILFIQCDDCAAKLENCCSVECKDVIHLPEEQQRQIRQKMARDPERKFNKSFSARLRLSIDDISFTESQMVGKFD